MYQEEVNYVERDERTRDTLLPEVAIRDIDTAVMRLRERYLFELHADLRVMRPGQRSFACNALANASLSGKLRELLRATRSLRGSRPAGHGKR